jgi:hypothetical protein
MSFRASMLALASIAALAITVLAPTGASAFADGSVHFYRFGGHAHYGLLHHRTRLDPYKS